MLYVNKIFDNLLLSDLNFLYVRTLKFYWDTLKKISEEKKNWSVYKKIEVFVNKIFIRNDVKFNPWKIHKHIRDDVNSSGVGKISDDKIINLVKWMAYTCEFDVSIVLYCTRYTIKYCFMNSRYQLVWHVFVFTLNGSLWYISML